MTDPFDALRIPHAPVDPDPQFARDLRARIERALLAADDVIAAGHSTEEPAETVPLHALTPYLSVVDAAAAVEFYVAVFGARRRSEPIFMPDGRIGHAEVVLRDSVLMLAEEFPELGLLAPVHRGGASLSIRLELPDPDAAIERAVAHGATVERPVADAPYGRGGVVVDPSGHRWMVSTPAGPRHGDVSSAWLGTRDVARADRFYPQVFDWTTVGGPDQQKRQVVDLITPLGIRELDRAPTLVAYYVVPDVDTAAGLVRAAGGTAASPVEQPYGRTVDCADDQGLPFTLVAPAVGRSTTARRSNGHGELDFVVLRVPDAVRARAFYGTVLGWRFRPGAGPSYWYVEPMGGPPYPAIGLEGGHAEATAVPWFRVPDLAAALAAVRAAGGSRYGPERQQLGRRVECVDDQGARFGLAQL